jgi:hypothetical protein
MLPPLHKPGIFLVENTLYCGRSKKKLTKFGRITDGTVYVSDLKFIFFADARI